MRESTPSIGDWVRALERRHSEDLSFREIRKGVQALSWRYVERRATRGVGATLDGRGKRAAFALYYAPLHLIVVRHVAATLQREAPPPSRLLDLGCGTGAGAAAWCLATADAPAASRAPAPTLLGVDVNAWAVRECQWNWRTLGLRGRVRRADLATFDPGDLAATGVVAAYTLNELPDAVRDRWLRRLTGETGRPARLLVVEPISRAVSPWWPEWTAAIRDAGGRDDVWELRPDLPEPLPALDRAAGLRHTVLKARSLWLSR